MDLCPFLEQADVRCADHWSLKNIVRAFACCAGNYTSCPVYQQRYGEYCVHGRVEEPVRLLAAS